ncbi:MAG: hypothetical protein OXF23_00610 [Candidatus Dadabacteria bacterium]|nr:hypothetical protein [Candidatus Dadabacteria bacterium]
MTICHKPTVEPVKDRRAKTVNIRPHKRRLPKPKLTLIQEIAERSGGEVLPRDKPKDGTIENMLGKNFSISTAQTASRP